MTSPSTEQVSPQTLRKVIIAAGIGNFVEWFDFAVYGFLATTIAQQFFPSGDASAALAPPLGKNCWAMVVARKP